MTARRDACVWPAYGRMVVECVGMHGNDNKACHILRSGTELRTVWEHCAFYLCTKSLENVYRFTNEFQWGDIDSVRVRVSVCCHMNAM